MSYATSGGYTGCLTSLRIATATYLTGITHTAVTLRERTLRMRSCHVSARYTALHLVVTAPYLTSGPEGAAVVMVMIGVAVMPIAVICPATVYVPPSGIITPIPRRMPCVPSVTPEPVVYYRTIDINRLYDIVRTIYVLIAYYLNRHLVFLVLLHIYRCNVLVDILCQHGLQNDQTLAAFTGLYHAQIIHLPVSVEIEVTESTVRIIEHRLELLQVLSLCEQFSYHLQVQSFGYVRTVGGNGYRLIRP